MTGSGRIAEQGAAWPPQVATSPFQPPGPSRRWHPRREDAPRPGRVAPLAGGARPHVVADRRRQRSRRRAAPRPRRRRAASTPCRLRKRAVSTCFVGGGSSICGVTIAVDLIASCRRHREAGEDRPFGARPPRQHLPRDRRQQRGGRPRELKHLEPPEQPRRRHAGGLPVGPRTWRRSTARRRTAASSARRTRAPRERDKIRQEGGIIMRHCRDARRYRRGEPVGHRLRLVKRSPIHSRRRGRAKAPEFPSALPRLRRSVVFVPRREDERTRG